MEYPEHDLVPFSPVDLRGERLLVVAPHPDDEAIGCGGLIAMHAREGRVVRVIVVSDGAEGSADAAARERETLAGLEVLGVSDVEFLQIADRAVESHGAALQNTFREAILSFRPDLIACPSPIEIHPDHLATARALVDAIQSDSSLVGDAAVCSVAFYEVSQPFRPNAIVDITPVADEKFRAIRAHASQLAIRDYDAFARGLNRYRAMTLPSGAMYGEAYFVMPLLSLHTTGWTRLREEMGPSSEVRVVSEPVPVTVIVRTKDRLPLLREALDSIAANDYPAEIVVVNDGGASVAEVVHPDSEVLLIEHAAPRGRSEAMNAGVRAAATPWLAFLDDDDLLYPDHLATLAAGVRASGSMACYTDALSVFMELSPSGEYEASKQLRIYSQPFDRELLLFDNYIPLPTLMLRRTDFLDLGGFDPTLDLFEDWDFLLRLSARGPFVRIPRLTCEIRHFPSAGSIIVDNPEGSSAFRNAKLEIWRRHSVSADPGVLANVFERQKRTLLEHYSRSVEDRGRARRVEQEIDRLSREKEQLINELQLEKNAATAAQSELAIQRSRTEGLERQLSAAHAELDRITADLDRVSAASEERDGTIGKLYAEIERLNGMLETIYSSRSWKLHRVVENLRGKR